MAQVRRVAEVRPGPGGRKTAFVVREPLLTATQSKYFMRIYLAEGKAVTPISPEASSATSPRWSPTGERLAFLMPVKGVQQIHIRETEGTLAPLTEMPRSILQFTWSPDGTRIAFLMADAGPDPTQPHFRGQEDPKVRLYVVPTKAGGALPQQANCISPDSVHLQCLPGVWQALDWSPSGRQVACIRIPAWPVTAEAKGQVSLIDVQDRTVRDLSEPDSWLTLSWERSGARIAALKDIQGDQGQPVVGGEIHLLSVTDGKAERLPPTPDRFPRALAGWTRGGELLLVEDEGIATVFRLWDPRTRRYRRLDDAAGGTLWWHRQDFAMDPSGAWLGFSRQRWNQPPEAFVTGLTHWKPQQVSAIHDGLQLPPVPKTEWISWSGSDGLKVDGILTYPCNWKPGMRVPAIIELHGGPIWCYTELYQGGFDGKNNYAPALFAQHGFAVLQVNFRGSTGRGWDYRAHANASMNQDVLDVVSAADALLARGIADPEKLGVMGWSYGGYLTARTLVHTQRFKAASVGAGKVDLFVSSPLSEAFMGGPPREQASTYLARSPLYHAKAIRTPVLIQHGEEDRSVPFWQAEAFYEALLKEGREARFQAFPGMGHSPSDPRTAMRLIQTNLDWFKAKLKPDATSRSSRR